MLPKTKRAIFVRLLFFGKFIGGDEGGRTPDLCNAIAALCQTELRPHFSMLQLKVQQKPNRKYNNPPLIKQLQTGNLQVEISALFTFKNYARIILIAVSLNILMRQLEFLKRQILVTHVSQIPVRIDFRWFFVFALMSWITAVNLSSSKLIDNFLTCLVFGALTTLVLFVSIFLHEFAHAVVARMEGVEVLEIVLHPFGGLARFRREPDTPRAEFRIAIAGPAASFLLAIAFVILMAIANSLELKILVTLWFFLALWNFLLAVFNMFPGYPLDGGRVLRAYLWRRGTDLNEATILTGKFGKIIALALIVFGILILVFSTDGFFTGFWTILVGLFLYDSASGIIKQVNKFENLSVEEAMQLPVTIEPESSVLKFVDTILPLHRQTIFLVAENKQFYGVLMLEDLKKLPREDWQKTKIRSVMRPVAPEYFVETNATLTEAKSLMRENDIGSLGVINTKGELVGFLQRGRLRKRS
jgi:Zn-dependent protease/CBS domain-containing protein